MSYMWKSYSWENTGTDQTWNKNTCGYDLDHYPTTWAERAENMKSSGMKYTRKDVLDCYNSNVRCQCPECNQKHIFEGIKGDFANGK